MTTSNKRRFLLNLFLMMGLVFVLVQPTLADDTPFLDIILHEGLPTSDDTVTADAIGWCPTSAPLCRVNRDWTIDELSAHFDVYPWAVWQEGDQLIFALHGQVDDVRIAGGISTSLIPIGNSDYWVATIQIQNLDYAVVSYQFMVMMNDMYYVISDSYDVWRGDHAPQAPEYAYPIEGQLRTIVMYSPALDEIRTLSFYLPPNHNRDTTYPVVYMTDGQTVASFAQVIEPLIQRGDIPPTILVGVHSAPYDNRDRRAEEYLLGYNDEAYTAHEQFFTQTVRRWAELALGASQDPSERAMMGFSNGGAFVGNTGVRQPDLYGHIMMFSPTMYPQATLRSRIDARYYLLAGTLEPQINTIAQQSFYILMLLGVDTHYTQWVAGHEYVMWQGELPKAMGWMFAD